MYERVRLKLLKSQKEDACSHRRDEESFTNGI